MCELDKIRRIVREQIRSMIEAEKSGLLVEMALRRKVYKNRIDNLMPQVIENWCLVHYCTLSGNNLYKEHWKSELRGYIVSIFRLAIKDNNSEKSRNHVFSEIWIENEFDEPSIIDYVINTKFKREKIDTTTETYADIIADFVFSQKKLIEVMLSKDYNVLDSYLETI